MELFFLLCYYVFISYQRVMLTTQRPICYQQLRNLQLTVKSLEAGDNPSQDGYLQSNSGSNFTERQPVIEKSDSFFIKSNAASKAKQTSTDVQRSVYSSSGGLASITPTDCNEVLSVSCLLEKYIYITGESCRCICWSH